MIAKLIVWGEDRAQAIARLRGALAQTHIVGVANNVDFLERLLANPAFAGAELDTGLIERERDALFAGAGQVPATILALACARILADEAAAQDRDPWANTRGWRLNTTYTRRLSFRSEQGVHEVELDYGRSGFGFRHADLDAPLAITTTRGSQLDLRFAGRSLHADVVRTGLDFHVFAQGRHAALTLMDAIAQSNETEAGSGRLSAPMPGKLVAFLAQAGDSVTKGQPLAVMEAMKMEHTISSPRDGKVAELLFAIGDQVTDGAELLRLEA